MLEQLKSGFKRITNWNKYQIKKSVERSNQYLDYLIDLSFQQVNRLFVLLFESETQRRNYKRYYLPTVEIKIVGQKFFGQIVRNDLIKYDRFRKIATGQGDITQLVVCWTILISENTTRG